MLACLDTDYREDETVVGCVLFHDWTDAEAAVEQVTRLPPAAPYEPGHFYRRELPGLLHALSHRLDPSPLFAVIIDGYVWLDEAGRPGLGAHLAEALPGQVIIGVAKTVFRGSGAAEVLRGDSQKPLFVTAAGMDKGEAARQVARMHGPHRVPTLIRRADQLCRRG